MLQTAQRTAKPKRKKRASATPGEAAADKTAPPHERFLEAFRWMLLTRTLEEKLVSLYRGGQITGGVYIGKGQEAVSVACGLFLEKGDIFAPLIRDQAGRSAFGEPLVDVTRTYLGSRLGPMRGRDGNIHRGHPRDNELAMISHLGAMVSVTVGTLMAKRFRGEKNFVGLTCIGEGGMQTGAFHEGMNIAAVEQVPLVIVATNNHYAYSTPNDREFACDDLVERAIGYGFEGYRLDGTDLAACLDVIGGAVNGRVQGVRHSWLLLRFCVFPVMANTMTHLRIRRDETLTVCPRLFESRRTKDYRIQSGGCGHIGRMAKRRRRTGRRGGCHRSKRSRAGRRQRGLVRFFRPASRRPRGRE